MWCSMNSDIQWDYSERLPLKSLTKKSSYAQMAHIQVKIRGKKKVTLLISLRYVLVTQSMLCMIFFMYVATIKHLNYKNASKLKRMSLALTFILP